MDRPPEDIKAQPGAVSVSIEEALALPDPSTDPEGEVALPSGAPLATPDYSDIVWPPGDEAPDYAWLEAATAPATFTLTPDTIEALFRLGRYSPSREAPVIAFALRGAGLASGTVVTDASKIAMDVATPDHRHFRCVIGLYEHGARRLSAFTGSTVPCRKAIYGSTHGGTASNMLPTGLYSYYVWRHKTLKPALRLSHSRADLEGGARVTVLRNTVGTKLDTSDIFDLSTPYDNVHCSYYLAENEDLGAEFSSWGCLTVRGTKAPSEGWEIFQGMLSDVGLKSRVDLLLSTGKEASLVASGGNNAAALDRALCALRQGSRGDEVVRVQQAIGVVASGFWGAETADRFTARQRALNEAVGNGSVADGIYGRATDALTGWNVFTPLTG